MQISLITVCFNNEDTILDTLNSVNAQSVEFEFLTVDGGSKDSTTTFLRNLPKIDHFLSEPDKGLYDALNKAISISGGSIVGFIHADDILASVNVIELVTKYFEENPDADAVYGDLDYLSEDLDATMRHWKSGQPQSFITGWMPPHPTLYVKKEVYDRIGGFRTDLGSAADYEWMLRAIQKHKIKLAYIPHVLVHMRVGGMSNKNLQARKSAFWYDLQAWRVNGYGWPTAFIAVALKKLRKLPQFVRAKLRRGC